MAGMWVKMSAPPKRRAKPSVSAAGPSSPSQSLLYRLKITLYDEYKPNGERWRRVVVPANFSLLELHVVIQCVFGWENCHKHQFKSVPKEREENADESRDLSSFRPVEYSMRVGEYNYDSDEPDARDERVYKLRDVLDEDNKFLEYEYDFGESWEHSIEFEGIAEEQPGVNYPLCEDGKCSNRKDDNRDLDEDRNRLPEWRRKRFSRVEAQRELRDVFGDDWKADKTLAEKCSMCAFGSCMLSDSCDGKCCEDCLKADRGNPPSDSPEAEDGSSSAEPEKKKTRSKR